MMKQMIKRVCVSIVIVGMLAIPTLSNAWETKAVLGFKIYDGNDDRMITSAGIVGEQGTVFNNLKLAIDYEYSEENNEKESERIEIEEEYNQNISGRLYWLMNSSLLYDTEKDLERRTILSSGLGYRLITLDNMTVALEGGGSYIITKYDNMPVEDDAGLMIAGIINFEITENISLEGRTEYYPNIENRRDFFIKSDLTLELNITEFLGMQIGAHNEYCHLPEGGNEQNDFSLLSALVYRF